MNQDFQRFHAGRGPHVLSDYAPRDEASTFPPAPSSTPSPISDGSRGCRDSQAAPFASWTWSPAEPGPSSPHFSSTLDGSIVHQTKERRRQSATVYTSPVATDLPSDFSEGHHTKYRQFSPSPPASMDLLSPLSLPHGLDKPFHPTFEPQDSDDARTDDDQLFPQPFGWPSRGKSILSSPFSEDSDSDDGLAPSPFSSPETTSEPEEEDLDDDTGRYFTSNCTPLDPVYHPRIEEYPHFDFYPIDNNDDDLPPLQFSFSPRSLTDDTTIPTAPLLDPPIQGEQGPRAVDDPLQGQRDHRLFSSSSSAYEQAMSSPTLSSTPLPPLFDHDTSVFLSNASYGGYDEFPPSSPSRRRSMALPSFDDSQEPPSALFGSPSTISDELIQTPPSRFRSLPGADLDDDLITPDLADKNYTPNTALIRGVQTVPQPQNMLIYDPTTTDGVPVPLGWDEMARKGKGLADEDDDERFVVDSSVIASLSAKDSEKGSEAKKLCQLQQRVTSSFAAACNRAKAREKDGFDTSSGSSGLGGNLEADRARERWREISALLRLGLIDAKASDDSESSTRGDAQRRSDSTPTPFPSTSTDTITNVRSRTVPTPKSSRSKPKITSMSQLVATMVLQRQQEAARHHQEQVQLQGGSRARSWPGAHLGQPAGYQYSPSPYTPKAGVRAASTGGIGLHIPTSPLRQMSLPEDLEDGREEVHGGNAADEGENGELSPLFGGNEFGIPMCASPEGFFAQLDGSHLCPQMSLLGALE